MAGTAETEPKHHKASGNEKVVIGASSLGTVFEWYDFYLYGSLATYISAQFFSGVNETTGFIFALGAFAYAKTAGDAFTGIAQSLSDRIAQSRARRRKQEK